MPASSLIAPFCVAQNATCCANTYCNADETCCGSACCPKVSPRRFVPLHLSIFMQDPSDLELTYPIQLTTCVRDQDRPAACCPRNQTCSGPITCIDNSSPDCTNSFDPTWVPPSNCCPSSLPYCRNSPSSGPGCYASSTASKEVVVSTTATEVDFVSLLNLAVATSTSVDQVATIAKETLTLDVIPLGAEMFTYAFPSVTPTPGITALDTVWRIDVLTSTLTLTLTETSKSVSKSQGLASTRTVTLSSATPPSSTMTAATPSGHNDLTTVLSNTVSSASETPTLCFNPDRGTLLPCTASPSPSSSTAGDVFSPQGAVVVNSSPASPGPKADLLSTTILAIAIVVLLCALILESWAMIALKDVIIHATNQVVAERHAGEQGSEHAKVNGVAAI